ncbi:MAG: peptide chain release factor N(5)-glutamine methyltransferase [Pirellulales bacterium]|nr:peptide chain release factor N(5)-glutamine methyltransferase [Pirellulales bacterium]
MPQTETWTIGRLLEWTSNYLRERGADSPRLDAEVLLAEALGCRRIDLYTKFAEEPSEQPRTAFRELVRRRAEGTPVAYLVGRREFYSLSFRVTPDVLIPRPETEFVVLALLDFVKERGAERNAPFDIADVGAGSGILAICAAKYVPGSQVLAIDKSAPALAVAQANATEHGVAERIKFAESDLFAQVAADRQFDFIVSNPPYISTAEMAALPADVARYEPHLALEAGPRGTDVIERLIPQAAERLRPGGVLLIEISPTIEGDVKQLVAQESRFEFLPTRNDLSGLARVVQLRRKS